jgi:carbonic anhydrase
MRARVLVIACVDFRFTDPLIDWLRAQGLGGQYDLRTHESASLAVDRWLESAVAINRLHDVEAVWIVDHDDCGAYRLAGEPNSRENHVQHLKAAEARVQAWVGKPVRIFFHPLGPDGRGGAALEEVT